MGGGGGEAENGLPMRFVWKFDLGERNVIAVPRFGVWGMDSDVRAASEGIGPASAALSSCPSRLPALPASSPRAGSRLPCCAVGLKRAGRGVYTWIAYAAAWLIWVATPPPLEALVDLHGSLICRSRALPGCSITTSEALWNGRLQTHILVNIPKGQLAQIPANYFSPAYPWVLALIICRHSGYIPFPQLELQQKFFEPTCRCLEQKIHLELQPLTF